MYIVLISRHFANCSFPYLIGTPSPTPYPHIPSTVSPISVYSKFLSWNSLWNAHCFVILFCSFPFCLFVARAQWLANFVVVGQFYTAYSFTVSISVFKHCKRQFTVRCLKFFGHGLHCSLPSFHSWCAIFFTYFEQCLYIVFIARVEAILGNFAVLKILWQMRIMKIMRKLVTCESFPMIWKWDLRRIMRIKCLHIHQIFFYKAYKK